MRLQSIDALRGVAILGILFMNIYFHGSIITGYGELTPKPFTDTIIEALNSVFIDGRFRTLFCLLFGAGLAIQHHAYKKKKYSPKAFLTIRMNWLMLFGLVHGIFIFGGDILLLYSVCALSILNSLNLPLKKLRRKAYLFLSIGAALALATTLVLVFFLDEQTMLRASTEYNELYQLWFSGYFNQLWIQGGIAISIVLTSPLFIYWQVTGLMMLGAFLYRIGFFKRGFTQSQLFIISLAALSLICIDFIILLNSPALTDETSSILASTSAIFVALIYAHIVIKLSHHKNKIIAVLSNVGKVAFSLYILQSIAMAMLLRFWHQGFHLSAQRVDYVLIACGFTLIQILIAHYYLQYFKQGPLEYLWRKACQHSLYKRMYKNKNAHH
ncbi:DUF418 domain-containing protein [Colwellia sp. D2M02]|uniref:DUF418 domain-containing protein n=1 Tax=Colwellia sp. D2M02 TaxID=2841562 RepID=UPI001C089495|nr:DUF418 domain-containing protein [Colwellia sp. D2M02]MBU2893985.1 DUF418 domain-containing protein [Colwellia sp. D2M02]